MAVTIDGTDGIETNTDTGKIKLGASDDLQLYHLSNNNYIVANTTGQDIFFKTSVSSAADTSSMTVRSDGSITHPDNIKSKWGTGDDLKLFHNGTDSYIEDSGTGSLILDSNEIKFTKYGSSEVLAKFIGDGAVELYYDNSKKFFTYSEGVKVDGYIKAHPVMSDSHWGDNANNWNFMGDNVNSSSVLICEHSGDTAPYGIEVVFTDNTPDNNANWFYYAADLSAARFRVYSDGDVWTSDSGTLSSDETLKENIVDASPKLEDLKKLKVRNFNWKSSFHPEKSKKKQLGFIAQEVEEVFPALITEHDIASGSPDNSHTPVMKKAIKQAWDPIIIKAMQELIAKVETLETKVAALEAG